MVIDERELAKAAVDTLAADPGMAGAEIDTAPLTGK